MSRSVYTLTGGLRFPEGPAFDRDGLLWCVEFDGQCLSKWLAPRLERHPTGGNPNGLAFDSEGRAWFCDPGQNSVRRLSPEGDELLVMADRDIHGRPLRQPNDLAFDPAGNLLFTCPGDSRAEPTGVVHCLRPDGSLTVVADSVFFPNGLAFVEGGSALVVAETYRHRLLKGAWDSTALCWINPKPWAVVGGPIGPDGLALGADGTLYVAVYGKGHIAAVAPDGRIVNRFPLPGKNPTNVAFDPGGEMGLVVTEAEKGLLLSIPSLGPGAALFDGAGRWT